MSFFSKVRRAKQSKAARAAGAEAAADVGVSEVAGIPATTDPAPSRKGVRGTLEKLVTLHGSRMRFQPLCAEALKLILEAFGVRRGVLLVYDPHSWDMPVHALLNESAYLIDQPGDNRYVPQLLDSGNGGLARVACVPIYRQRTPVGAFVLLAERGERLTETEIQLAHVSLRYVATIIDDAHQREGLGALTGAEAGLAEDGPPEPEPHTAAVVPIKPPRREIGDAVPDAEPAFLRDGQSEPIPLTEAEEVAVPVTAMNGVDPSILEAVEASEREARAEIERLQAELSAARSNLEARAVASQAEHDESLTQLREELDDEHTRILAAVRTERDDLSARLTSVSEALDLQQAELQARAGDGARVRDLESELLVAHDRASETAQQLQAMRRELEEGRCRIDELEVERTRLAAEATAARDLVGGDRGSEGADVLLDTRAAEIAVLNGRLAAAEAKVEARGRAIQELKATNTRLKDERSTALDDLARANERFRSMEADIELGRTEIEELKEQLAAAGTQEDASGRAIATLRSTAERLEAERKNLSQRSQALEAELHALRQAVAAGEQATDELRKKNEQAESARREAVEREQLLLQREASVQAQVQGLEMEREAQLDRLSEVERAGQRALEESRQQQDTLRQQVQQSRQREERLAAEVETAAARIEEVEAREAAARREAVDRRYEAETLAEKITELEAAMHGVTARATKLEAQVETARSDEARWRGEFELARERAAESVAELEAHWQAQAERLDDGVTALDQRARKATDRLATLTAALDQAKMQAQTEAAAHAALQQRVRELEAELGGPDRPTLARLESERRAAYADAARAREEAAAHQKHAQELEAAQDKQARTVASLEAAVARLEADRAIRAQQNKDEADPKEEAAETKTAAAQAGAVAAPKKRRRSRTKANAPERFVVIEPTASVGKALVSKLGEGAQLVAPTSDPKSLMRAVQKARATAACLNLGSRGDGGFQVLRALGTGDAESDVRTWAYMAPLQANKGIALGFLEWVSHGVDSDTLVDLLLDVCNRGSRVLSVGLEIEGLPTARARLKAEGVSLSMACDSKQGQELLDVVHPHAIVVNLDLPRGDGYRAIGRLAGTYPRPVWILCGGKKAVAEAGSLVVTGAAQRVAADSFLTFADMAGAFLEDLNRDPEAEKVAAVSAQARRSKGAAKGADSTAPNRANVRIATTMRRTTAGSQRRMPGA
jgi:hypothetical protein